MNDLAVHPVTAKRLADLKSMPSHAVMLVGPAGSGKSSLAAQLAAELLSAPEIVSHPYVLLLKPIDGKQIPIDSVRDLERFLSLKVPAQSEVNRIVIVEDAHMLGQEGQNALLKTLEEPPAGTLLILTVSHEQALLPTIRSRVTTIQVNRPARDDLVRHFKDSESKAVDQAYAVSGGLPGLMYAMLNDEDHPLRAATEKARQLLGQSAYERLASLDELAKNKRLALDVTFILQQMARISLQKATGPAAKRWQRVLEAAYQAAEALESNAQPKLALTKLMLSL